MLNLFSKTTSWMVASLLATTVAISAQDTTKIRPRTYEQGHEVEKNQLMPAYSAPASISVRGSWDVYATGSFLYWQAREDNLEVGIISDGSPLLGGGPFVPNTLNFPGTIANTFTDATVANSKFSYGPGFKLGVGLNLDYDNWDAYAEYTWFHKRSNTNVSVDGDCECAPVDNRWIFPTRGLPVGTTTNVDTGRGYKSAAQSWKAKLDFLDLLVARNYYSGTRLSMRPFFGARGAWIRQGISTTFSSQAVGTFTPAGAVTAIAPSTAYSATQSANTRSWGVGPRVGLGTNWMVGCGFRLIGDVAGDILYTRYDAKAKGVLNQDYLVNPPAVPVVTAVGSTQGNLNQKHIDMLRAHADLEMGLGWGSYFDNSNWHVDVLATYGYQVFWDQNMFRMFDNGSARSTTPNGNLYVHGLTLTARVDF